MFPPIPTLNTLLIALLTLTPRTALSYITLPSTTLHHIPSGGSDFDPTTGALLAPLLIPRVPGTPGSAAARRHFVDFFTTHLPRWTVATHNSTSTTPATGDTIVPFTNLIFRRDPPWAAPGDVARLTLVAHYDTLYRPEGFVGAVDSAASCAVLMHVARSVDAALTRRWDATGEGDGLGEEEVGVQILLLDGEEAWESWTDSDSLYGSRALAEEWAATRHEGVSTFETPLKAISLFVLLDLLGAADPSVASYFENTHWAYGKLSKAERRLREQGLLESKPKTGRFLPDEKRHSFSRGYVLDDHVPFLQRGVDILHVIPTPFPAVWHTMDDDGAHLDVPTLRDWARIMTVFVAEWMELGEYLEPALGDSEGYKEKDEL